MKLSRPNMGLAPFIAGLGASPRLIINPTSLACSAGSWHSPSWPWASCCTWGEGGILSLGQGVFFGLGGYALAMHLKLEGLNARQMATCRISWSGAA
jgi:hypothetical protein